MLPIVRKEYQRYEKWEIIAMIYSEVEKTCTQVRDMFDEDYEAQLGKTRQLEAEDLALIGQVIHVYNFADFNSRRVIDSIKKRYGKGEKLNGRILQDAQVYEELIKISNFDIDEKPLKNSLRDAGILLGRHQNIRNLLAHWACRKTHVDGVWFMTTYKRSAVEQKLNIKIEGEQSGYAIIGVAPIINELEKISKCADWMAEIAYLLEKETYINTKSPL